MNDRYPQETAVVFGGPGQVKPKHPLEPRMDRVREKGLGARVSRLICGRFSIVELAPGDCLHPVMTDRFGIVDLEADIRVGDVFVFSTKDFRTAFDYGPDIRSVAKRFRGINHQLRFIECECTKPAYIIHTGLTDLKWAYRIRATAPTLEDAKRLLKVVRWSPLAFDEPLMSAAGGGAR